MEARERGFDIPRGSPDELPLTKRVRRLRPPAEGRVYGFRRVPRNLAGGALGLGLVLYFLWALSDHSLSFLVMLGVVAGALALGIWALVKSPVRPRFDQRWRPRRRIRPLATDGWRRLADELGLDYEDAPLPLLRGRLGNVPIGLAFFRDGGPRTVATARLPEPSATLHGFPRRAEFSTEADVETGDRQFDQRWHLLSPDEAAPRQLLPPLARQRIDAARPEEFGAGGGRAWLRKTGFLADPEQARTLLLAAAAMAGGHRPDSR